MLRIALATKRTKTVVRSYYNQQGRLVQQETSVEKVDGIAEAGYISTDREIMERQEHIVAQMLIYLGLPPDDDGKITQAVIKAFDATEILNELDSEDFVERVLQPVVTTALGNALGAIYHQFSPQTVSARLPAWKQRSLWRDLEDTLNDYRDMVSLNQSPDADLTIDTLPYDVTPGLVTAPH